MTAADVQNVLNLLGIFAFALSGALLAVRKDMDIVGMAVLATLTSLGGGVIRDVLIGDTPPAALRNVWWLVTPLVATLVTFFFHRSVARWHRPVQVFDAIGLGVFCASAAAKAMAFGLSVPAAMALVLVTGIGGGILRDVLAGEIPVVCRRETKLYAVPAVLGSAAVALAWHGGYTDVWVQGVAALGICGLRLTALWRRWGAPAPRWSPPQRQA